MKFSDLETPEGAAKHLSENTKDDIAFMNALANVLHAWGFKFGNFLCDDCTHATWWVNVFMKDNQNRLTIHDECAHGHEMPKEQCSDFENKRSKN